MTSTEQSGPMTIDEKIGKAVSLKEEGNTFFKANDFTKAISKYVKIFSLILMA